MAHKDNELDDDDDEVMRECRRVRDELNRRFKTLDELFAWLGDLEKNGGPRNYVNLSTRRGVAQARAKRRARPALKSTKANSKAVKM
ncbi:MAG: hypothetical protein ABSE73_19470 [Planctomycetota bacterium]